MIARVWHGWTTRENAEKYEEMLQQQILPGIEKNFARGVELLRREGHAEIEFITICYFESMDEVKRFAGEHYELPVILPAAHAVLERFDSRAQHYEVLRRR